MSGFNSYFGWCDSEIRELSDEFLLSIASCAVEISPISEMKTLN